MALIIKAADFAASKHRNQRDIASNPPAKWNLRRRRKFFDWAGQVIDSLRGTHRRLERIFDQAYALRP